MSNQIFNPSKMKAHHYQCRLMGCSFVLTAVHQEPQIAWNAIRGAEAEIKRIEAIISSWIPTSQTGIINKMAGIAAVHVDQELYALISRSNKISELTSGAFDISGTLARYYWNFNNDKNENLSREKVSKLRSLIGYKNIKIDPSQRTVFLKKKGMKIGFGGIGKGYAATKAKLIMKENGIQSGLINASGDLICWGCPPLKSEWVVKIPNPKTRKASLMHFTLPYGAIVTSGNHEHFTIIDGKKHSHIVDPRTGYPVSHIQQVTVVSPDPEFADAMATALSALSIDEGIKVVNLLKGIECVIVDSHNQIYYSNHFLKFISAKAA